MLQPVVGHTIVDPIRAVVISQRGIETNRLQVHDLARVPCVAQAIGKSLQDGVTKRPPVVVRVYRQDSHGLWLR